MILYFKTYNIGCIFIFKHFIKIFVPPEIISGSLVSERVVVSFVILKDLILDWCYTFVLLVLIMVDSNKNNGLLKYCFFEKIKLHMIVILQIWNSAIKIPGEIKLNHSRRIYSLLLLVIGRRGVGIRVFHVKHIQTYIDDDHELAGGWSDFVGNWNESK